MRTRASEVERHTKRTVAGVADRPLRLAVGQSRMRNARPTSVEGVEEKGLTIPLDGIRMVSGCQKARLNIEPKPKSSDSEKITINLGPIDLGQIDLLVQEGFYSNRTDFIRTAIRNQLVAHAEAVRQTIARKTLVLGLQEFSRRDLESVRKAGSKIRIHVLGLVRIASDVSPALARDTIESVEVLGALHASPAVKAALADRII